MDTSDDALRTLSWQTFDQTPGQYWRQLADVRRYREAAELIERYLALHPELAEGAQQINGANLHFHAAQCHAFAKNKDKALAHLEKALHRLPLSDEDSLRWNCYVNGTASFLLGDHERMISAYVSLATQTTFSDPNLITLDRLLAGFGKPYAEAYEANESDDHKKLSADFFNRAWELLDREARSSEEDSQMRSFAHASLAHWRQREDCKPRNLSIAYWQLSRIYAVQRDWVTAQVFAHLCLSASEQEPPYYLGYAHEAMARAVVQKGDFPLFQKHLALARGQASQVTDADERKMLEKDLNELEASVPPELRPVPSSPGGPLIPGTAPSPVE
jgi:tetratricopeptide (TPR) repeat protein